MSEVNINCDTYALRANTVLIQADGDSVDMGAIGFPSRNGVPGQGFVISKSAAEQSNGVMHDSNGVIPDGTLSLFTFRLGDLVFWSFTQLNGASRFTVGATGVPNWVGLWPLTMRPVNNAMFLPVLVQISTGTSYSGFLIVATNGDISLNMGTNTFFTAGNQLYFGGSGIFTLTDF
jgi:hypothetical protein